MIDMMIQLFTYFLLLLKKFEGGKCAVSSLKHF